MFLIFSEFLFAYSVLKVFLLQTILFFRSSFSLFAFEFPILFAPYLPYIFSFSLQKLICSLFAVIPMVKLALYDAMQPFRRAKREKTASNHVLNFMISFSTSIRTNRLKLHHVRNHTKIFRS